MGILGQFLAHDQQKLAMGKGAGGASPPPVEPNYVSGPALDHSFMELERVAEALDEEPRAGVLGSKSRLRKVEEKEVKVVATGKKKQKPKVRSRYEVTTITTCLRMCNNSLENLDGLDEAVNEMFDLPEKVEWLDFSFNQLKHIDDVLLQYKDLKSLYLHGNQITNIMEILKLRELPRLKSLAMHGNAIEECKSPPYRLFVIGALPSLARLDFCTITPQDREEADLWFAAYERARAPKD